MLRLRALLIIMLTLFVGPHQQVAAQDSEIMPGEVLIKLAPGLSLSSSARPAGPYAAVLADTLHRAGASAAFSIGAGSNTYRVRVRDDADLHVLAATFSSIPGVLFAEPNAIRTAMRVPNDSLLRTQWPLKNIQAYEAWDITTGAEITIALLDTGVSKSHPDLQGRVLDGYDFHNNDFDASDDEGHGTYTAGVAAAEGDNEEGIAGVCWVCRILPVKVLGSRGQGNDAAIAAGIRWAADQGAHIISMSLGGTDDTQVLREATQYAQQRGALLIAASGNGYLKGNLPSYPAAYPDVMSVTATDGSDVVTGFSTTGDFVDISAPGVGVWSTVWQPDTGDGYAPGNGTSASCPYVAGAAALVLSIRPDLNAGQLAQVLTRSADDQGAPGKDDQNGWGRLNLLRAVQLASDPNLSFEQPAPTPGPDLAAFRSAAPLEGASYFPETQHNLRGEFRAYWERHGALPIFGFPISEELTEKGEDGQDYAVQYFERYRFELHPELAAPYNIQISRLGALTLAEQGRNWTSLPKSGQQAGCLYFAETGQSICEPFLSYWRSHRLEFDGRRGKSQAESLALFGLPLSSPQVETLSDGSTLRVQWFERARFEDHGAEGVLLGLLSSELTQRRGWR